MQQAEIATYVATYATLADPKSSLSNLRHYGTVLPKPRYSNTQS